MEKIKEIELDKKLDMMIEKYSKESVREFLEWLLNMPEAELNATSELCELIDRVEVNKKNENHQP
ncbi:hypothetical protein MPH47_17280 [Psychrobacillus psychrodurans]|uniref:hypothetical protein n=1 Tax=Psychrobacillus psychrodurans TaxID=126157 RepID=UPI001F4E4D10|nr:hypothetical protein [Psychrobacillus psychrodurans]MCK1998951.1 hypothetical protein [Psychrobacillus psychrodurans]